MLFLAVLLLVLSSPFSSFAVTYDYSYDLLNRPGGSTYYRLSVSVTSSLYDYYQSKDHSTSSLSDLAKFVTPNTLSPIADDLWSIYSDEEDFANGVLMIVHQIPYNESGPQKYPVETLVENEGDCDLFSFIAASIMKAGGLDVVLLYYEEMTHMNVGVYLLEPPNDARFDVYYFRHGGKRYYVAECTGDWNDWENGWRVGECPDEFRGVSAEIITLENCEQWSPEQVSSSLAEAASSTLTLQVSSKFVIEGMSVTVSGSISSISASENVTIYVSSDGLSWNFLEKATTDSQGYFSCTWKPRTAGTNYVRASWPGDEDYKGADSAVYTFFVLPLYWLLAGVACIAMIIVLALIRPKKTDSEAIFKETF